MTGPRQNQFESWLKKSLNLQQLTLKPITGDASFRQYYRMDQLPNYLAVDAPPALEKTQEFVDVARAFERVGLNVPTIKDFDAQQGFLIVSYLGDVSYFQALQKDSSLADKLYKDAMQGLDKLIQYKDYHALHLEKFDTRFMMNELNYFTEWFLSGYLKLDISETTQKMLDKTYLSLTTRAENQPQVCVHRDYHSRNLIVCDNRNPGIIDLQDAVEGPLTYDLVSLLRDAYIDWPLKQVKHWVEHFHQEYVKQEYNISFDEFYDDFNLMGVQRHLKATFIFARKWLRDHNPNYLNDIYRTLDYMVMISEQYPELKPFHQFMINEVAPKFSLEQAS